MQQYLTQQNKHTPSYTTGIRQHNRVRMSVECTIHTKLQQPFSIYHSQSPGAIRNEGSVKTQIGNVSNWHRK